jgi:hypothetical protein
MAGYEENIQQCLMSFSTLELKSPCKITMFQKCHYCPLWPEMDAKVGHFQYNLLRLFVIIASYFRRATENRLSSAENVRKRQYANGQSDRIVVPETT